MIFTWELNFFLEYPTQPSNHFIPSDWTAACNRAKYNSEQLKCRYSYRNSSLRFSACSPIHQWTSLSDSYKKKKMFCHMFRATTALLLSINKPLKSGSVCVQMNSISIGFQWEEQVLNSACVNLCHFSKVIHISRAWFSPQFPMDADVSSVN